MTVFIGDVHGKWSDYNRIIQNTGEPTIQIGDFGIGFPLRLKDTALMIEYADTHPELTMAEIERDWPREDAYDIDLMRQGNHRFGRGNHDNPGLCKQNSQYLPDGYMVDTRIFWVGGALSIDAYRRTEGVDWWRDEELDYGEWQGVIDRYTECRPQILACHDCPEFVIRHMYGKNFQESSRTRQALQVMLDIHKPQLVVYGHHHISFNKEIDGVRYVCVPELGTFKA